MSHSQLANTGWRSAFELKWDKNEVKKLLNSSFLPCEYFYVGKAGLREPIEDRHYQIFNQTDFLSGKLEDLFDLGRLGNSYEHESLQLVEPGRKQERENREKNDYTFPNQQLGRTGLI